MEPSVSFRFPIEEGQVRRFAEASWDADSAARATSGTLEALPPTFLGAAATICGRPHSLPIMGFDVARAFHGKETVHLLMPVEIGDVLQVQESTQALSDVRGRRGGLMRRAVRQSTFFDARGEMVAVVDRVILEAENVPAPERPRGDMTVFDDGLDVKPDPVRGRSPAVSHVEPGTVLEAASFGPLTRSDFVRYAAASGDFTAVHFDEHAATSRGYPAPFAMGMLSAAYIGRMLTGWVTLVPPWRLSLRFREQVWPGETLVISGLVGRGTSGSQIDVTCAAADRIVTTATLQLAQAR